MKILIIGDAHINEHDNLNRFYTIKNVIAKEKIDKIVIIGDFLSMDCLSDWDKNKKKIMEGKRFKKEIEQGNKALDIIQENFKKEIIYIEGNHEHRVERYLEINPTFDGMVNIPVVLKCEERGIKYIPYKENYNINGISFIHIPIAATGRPISGANITKKALSMYANSVVFGHTHKLEMTCETRHNAGMNKALSVGCFFEGQHDYKLGSVENEWKGLIILETNKNNSFDIKTYNLDDLLNDKKYKEEIKLKNICDFLDTVKYNEDEEKQKPIITKTKPLVNNINNKIPKISAEDLKAISKKT